MTNLSYTNLLKFEKNKYVNIMSYKYCGFGIEEMGILIWEISDLQN